MRDPNWHLPGLHPHTKDSLRTWGIVLFAIGVIVIVCLLFLRPAHAATWLNMSAASHHFGERADGQAWQEFNPGVGLEWNVTALPERVSLLAGAFRNSFDRTTLYAGAHVRTFSAGPVSLGIALLGATGYPHTDVIGGATLTYTAERWRIQLLGIPPIDGDKHVGVIALQFGFQLD